MEVWARQDFEKAECEAKIIEEYASIEKQRKSEEVNLAMKNNAAFQDVHMLDDDIKETQLVLRRGRKAGTHAGECPDTSE
jgi:hypothetical protein